MRARRIGVCLCVLVAIIINWHITKNKAIAYFLKNAEKDKNGLTGFYYQNTERFGIPSLIRVAPRISFNSNTSPEFQKDYFSANWLGLIYIEKRGKYTFGTASDDGSWLYIDHKKIVDNGDIHPKKKASGRIYLKKGYHSVELGYNEIKGDACIELYWRQPGGIKEIIPAKFLIPVSKDFNIHKVDRLYMNMLRIDILFLCLLYLLSYLAHI